MRRVGWVVCAVMMIACGGDDAADATPDAASPDDSAIVAAPDTLVTRDSPGLPDSAGATPSGLSDGAGIDPVGGGRIPAGPATQTAPETPAAPVGTAAPGQENSAAILQRASATYEKIGTMQADFVMTLENPLLKQRIATRGRIYQQRPDRIALRFTDPAGDLIVGDGEYFYVYYRDVNPTQATRTTARSVDGSSVDLQAQFLGNPVERFNHRLEGSENVAGRATKVLVLVPRRQSEFRSLKVWIDDRDSLARQFEITEHNGSVRRFDLSNLRVNEPIPAATFQFVAPPGVRVVTIG